MNYLLPTMADNPKQVRGNVQLSWMIWSDLISEGWQDEKCTSCETWELYV